MSRKSCALYGSGRGQTLRALHAGLWRACRISLAISDPERVQGIIIQNAVAHDDGLGPRWNRCGNSGQTERQMKRASDKALRRWPERKEAYRSSPNRRITIRTYGRTSSRSQQSGESDIQIDLFFDYQTNVASYSRGRPGSGKRSRRRSLYGDDTINPLRPRKAQAYKRRFPTLRST